MFEKHYRSMNKQVVPEKSLVGKTLCLATGKTNGAKSKRQIRKNLPVAAAILLVCVLGTIPALAATGVPGIYELMYLVSPATAQFFAPVQESCEDNGIRMEVVATHIHENTAKIYVTMQDLTGDRVDETTDLFDSYSIHRPFHSMANCEWVGYDEETKTATFLITITEWGNRRIAGSKMTFSVRNFISQKQAAEAVALDVNLSTVDSGAETRMVEVTSGGGPSYDQYRPRDRHAKVLATPTGLVSPVDGIDITGIGYVDDRLHVQIAVKDPLMKDNHAYFFLKDKDGNHRLYDFSLGFREHAEPGSVQTRVEYDDYIFVIPQSEIGNYTLHGSFYTSGLYTEGKWQVTFPLR